MRRRLVPLGSRSAALGIRAPGITLIEMLVVIAMLGIVATLAGGALRRMDQPLTGKSGREPAVEELVKARREALATGSAVAVRVMHGGQSFDALTLPDGSVITRMPGIDRLAGRDTGATH